MLAYMMDNSQDLYSISLVLLIRYNEIKWMYVIHDLTDYDHQLYFTWICALLMHQNPIQNQTQES